MPGCRRHHHHLARRRRSRLALIAGACLIVTEHEQPYGRGEIAVLALRIDAADQIGQRHAAAGGDILQSAPERVLKADARLVPRHHDRALHDGDFMARLPFRSGAGRGFCGLAATGLFRGAVNLGAPMDEPVGCSLVLGCVPFGPLGAMRRLTMSPMHSSAVTRCSLAAGGRGDCEQITPTR